MPHGAGHHGGGHHGGGHHGGGHFHGGGGYHHHHHHHLGGGGWAWGWGYGPYRHRQWGYGYHRWGWGVGGSIFAVVIMLIVIAVSIRYTGDENASSGVPYYAPGDTLLLSYSSSFCESLTLRDTSSIPATLYVLDKKPQLSGFNNFSVSIDQPVSPGDYYYLEYYLYPGANLSLDACVTSQPVNFYVVRGQDNFNDWIDNPSGGSAQETLVISTLCSSGNTSHIFHFRDRAKSYYFPFDNFGRVSTSVRATFRFERPEYIIADNSTILKECHAGGTQGSSCNINIPLGSSYHVLLVVDPPFDGDWSHNVNVDWFCNARIWLYVVVVVAPLLFSVLCIILIAVTCWCVKTKRWKKYRPLSEPSTSDPQPQYEAPPTAPPANVYGTTEPPPAYTK